MTENDLIRRAAEGELTEAELRELAAALRITLHDACDRFSEVLAAGYLRGDYSWETGDRAMNHLYGLAYANGDFCLPDFSWKVYEAFDEGEYIHREGPPELDGEPRTRSMLLPLLAGRA